MTREITSLLFLLTAPIIASGADGYRLCVSSAEQHHENQTLLEAAGIGKSNFRYEIQIGDGAKVWTTPDSGFEYELETAGPRYLVKIKRHGIFVESFWIDFEDWSTNALCLWFKTLYETWSVWSLETSGHLCDCDR